MLTLAWSLTVTLAGGPDFALANDYFRLAGRGAQIESLAFDPDGAGRHGPDQIRFITFEGDQADQTASVSATAESITIRGLKAREGHTGEIPGAGVPEPLGPGHTLGQSFTLGPEQLTRVSAKLPTWHTTDASALLRLRRDGPAGEVLAEERLTTISDNRWHSLSVAVDGPGRFYLELSEPTGTVGWWSGREVTYQQGQAHRDGLPLTDLQRALRIETLRHLGESELTLTLAGPRLAIRSTLTPAKPGPAPSRLLCWRVDWDNQGYDTGPDAVPFSRFYSDSLRYLPVHQLKRWTERGGAYELALDGHDWIEFDGTRDHDLRFQARGVQLRWQLDGDATSCRLRPQTATTAAGQHTAELTVELRPRDDALPADWPRFVMSDPTAAEQANTFFYERALSFPPVWGGATWHEWNLTTRTWQLGNHLTALRGMLAGYPITAEGYVHTWGELAGWPFPDTTVWDTRHFDTNARFILACWRYAAWTGDLEFLAANADRLRRAMAYQLTVLGGESGLIRSASEHVTGRHQGIGNNYWDILPFGHLDAYANAVWYASLEAFAQIEELLATVAAATPPERGPAYYRALRPRVKAAYTATFWDDEAGRFIGCVDVDGRRHDYGFTFVNLEAAAYGLASDAQARRIYHWLETGHSSSGEADIYSRWQFAPRATTLHNPRWSQQQGKLSTVPQDPWWFFGWSGTEFDEQCQDGGAILYTSFYDLQARSAHLGVDDAWQRWQAILARWSLPDRLCGGPPLYLGEHPQQIHPGATGTDLPFPESGLVPCWLLYSVLGLEATSQGLSVAPRLPSALTWAGLDNLGYAGRRWDIRVTGDEVTIAPAGGDPVWRWSYQPGSATVWRP